MGILNAQQHFLLPALAPVVYNLAIILGAWLLGPVWGVRGLTAGVVLGAAGHLLVQLPGLARDPQRMIYRPVLAARDTSLHEVARLMGPRVVGLAAVQINFVVTTILASSLAVGSLTALNYGWIIMLLPQGVIAQSVATALFPTLAALAARGDKAEMRRIFATILRNLLFLTLPAAVGLVILREPIIRLLFERGKFDAISTGLTAAALGFFALGLVGHAVVEIAVRAFYALKDTRTPVSIGILSMAISIGLSLLFMRLFERLGWPAHGGLALANSIAVMLEMGLLLVWLRPAIGGLSEGGLGLALAKMSLAAVGMAAALWLMESSLLIDNPWLEGLVGMIGGGVVYIGLAYLIGMEELKPVQYRAGRVIEMVIRRLSGRSRGAG
jgi:putative peptidoglycan lipid II flippase